MNQNAIIGLVLAVLVVGGGAWYVSTHPGAKLPSVPVEETASDASTSGTFAELMEKTGSWQCEVKAIQVESSSVGTVLMSDGKLRGDFIASVMGREIGAHLIHTDGYAFTWSDMLPQGVKVKLALAAGTSGGQGIDPSSKVEYSCVPWTVDESKFTLPTGVQFFEITAKP